MRVRRALILAVALAALLIVGVRMVSASDSPYNSDWHLCRELNAAWWGPLDPQWWSNECWKPEDPALGLAAG